jgi:small-conductance mechanosensitive channel
MSPLFQRYFPILILISLLLSLFLANGILKSIFVVENSTIPVLMSEKTEKTNKSDKHKNQDSIESARKKLDEAKDKYKSLRSKVNKTKADKENEARLLKEIKHWKKKADETGETHWRKGK